MRAPLNILADKEEVGIMGGKVPSGVNVGLEVEHGLKWEAPGIGNIPAGFLTTILHNKDRMFHIDGSGPAEWSYGVLKSPIYIMKKFNDETFYNEEGRFTWEWKNQVLHEDEWITHGCHWHFSPTDSAKERVGEWRAWQIIWNTIVTITPLFSPFMIFGQQHAAEEGGKFVIRKEAAHWAKPQDILYDDPSDIRYDILREDPPFNPHCREDVTGNPAGARTEWYTLPRDEEWGPPWTTNYAGRVTWDVPSTLEEHKTEKKEDTMEIRYGEVHPNMAAAGLRIFQRILKKCVNRDSPVLLDPSFKENLKDIRKSIVTGNDIYETLENSGPIQFLQTRGPKTYKLPGVSENWYPNAWDLLEEWLDQAYLPRNRYQHRVMWLIKQQGIPALNRGGMWRLNEHNLRWPQFPEVNLEVARYHR